MASEPTEIRGPKEEMKMSALVPADPATVGSFLTQIKYGDTASRLAAVKYAALVGTDLILPLGKVYAGSDQPAGRAAYEAIKRVTYNAGRPGAPAEAKSASENLLKLTSTEYPRQVRADAIELLGIVAGEADTKQLADLMADKDVGEDARLALERIPGKAAEDALKVAARGANSERRAAIDLSLRHRKMKRADLGVRK